MYIQIIYILNKKFSEIVNSGGVITHKMDTIKICGESIVTLHKDFQFQLKMVPTFATTKGFGPTDLTAALGDFGFYAAIGEFQVSAQANYDYSDNGKQQICYLPTVSVTHIYVYAKDSYSFNDKKGLSSSQYLGHWNKNGLTMVYPSVAADVANKIGKRYKVNVDFEMIDYPIATNSSFFGLINPKHVYYPIRNRDFNAWRNKFNRGGDIVVYSEFKKVKLKKTITVTLERICLNPRQFDAA